MTTMDTTTDLPFTLTPRAIEMGKKKLAEADAAKPPIGIRVGVRGGGCSGLSYAFDFATKVREGRDIVLDFEGLTIVVDHKSIDYLKGSVLAWNDALVGHGFRWQNPNVKADCGCGESFSV